MIPCTYEYGFCSLSRTTTSYIRANFTYPQQSVVTKLTKRVYRCGLRGGGKTRPANFSGVLGAVARAVRVTTTIYLVS